MYRLGVDLGTTYTAAATCVEDGTPSMLGLGDRTLQAPSLLYLQPDGSALMGEAAGRRGRADPQRLAREFKRRIGDPIPIIVAGSPHSPQSLTARILRWVLDESEQRLGQPPSQVTVTHPANWTTFKQEYLRQAIRLAELDDAQSAPNQSRPPSSSLQPHRSPPPIPSSSAFTTWAAERSMRVYSSKQPTGSKYSATQRELSSSAASTSIKPSCSTF